MPTSPSHGDTRQMSDSYLAQALAKARQQIKAPDGFGRTAFRNLDIATADFQAIDSELAMRRYDMSGDEQLCEPCEGTGYQIDSGSWELCLECKGLARVESQDPAYQAAMRGEG